MKIILDEKRQVFNTFMTLEVVKLLIYDFFFYKTPVSDKKCFLCGENHLIKYKIWTRMNCISWPTKLPTW